MPPPKSLHQALTPYARRLRLARAVSALQAALAPAALIVALWPGLGWACGLGLALAGALAWGWPVPPGRVARFADQTAGLDAAADTALALAAIGHPAAEAVALDALDGLARAPQPPWHVPPAPPWLLAFGLLALGLTLRPVEGPPPPAPPPRSPALARLDALEDAARRQGQDELVEAIERLAAKVEEAEATLASPELLDRRPPPEPGPSPEAEAPPAPEDGPPPAGRAEAPAPAARSRAEAAMLAEFTRALEQHLMALTQEQALSEDLLGETLHAAELDHALGDMRGPSALSQLADLQSRSNQLQDLLPASGADLPDPAQVSGMRTNEMDQAGHELQHALQQSYRDFLDAYAQALGEELLEAMREARGEGSGEDGPEGEGGAPGGGEGEGGEAATQPASLSEGPSGAALAEATLAQASGQGKGRGQASAGGADQTGKGGAGAGGGGSDEGEAGGASRDAPGGELERLSGRPGPGQLDPGQLDPGQRQAMLDAMARMAASGGPGDDFGEAWSGWFDEVERALVEEDLHPITEGVARAYFAGLSEE